MSSRRYAPQKYFRNRTQFEAEQRLSYTERVLGSEMPLIPGSPSYFKAKYNELLALTFRMRRPPTLLVTITTSAMDDGLLMFLRRVNGNRATRAKDDLVMSTIYYEFRAKQVISAITGSRATGNIGIFGKVEAFLSRLEYQQSALPHHHILVWLAPEDEERVILDGVVVRSTAPDKEHDGVMHDIIVTKGLGIHHCRPNKCRLLNPNRCAKGYPRPLRSMIEKINNRYYYEAFDE